MKSKILDSFIKYGPIVLTMMAAILTKKQDDKDKAEMINEITKGVLKGIKKK